MDKTVKSGWKTSEFWLAAGAGVIPVLAMVFRLTQEQTAEANAQWARVVPEVVGMITFAVGIYRYIHARQTVKETAMVVENDKKDVVIP